MKEEYYNNPDLQVIPFEELKNHIGKIIFCYYHNGGKEKITYGWMGTLNDVGPLLETFTWLTPETYLTDCISVINRDLIIPIDPKYDDLEHKAVTSAQEFNCIPDEKLLKIYEERLKAYK